MAKGTAGGITPGGLRRERVAFYKRRKTNDGAGNYEADWNADPEFVCAARITPLMGGEEVMEARLQGVQPVVLNIRSSRAARSIDNQWKAVNTRTGVTYNIKTLSDFTEKRIELDIMCEVGTLA